jgi:hypothetical protein
MFAIKAAAAAAVLSAVFAGAAFARSEVFTARLQSPSPSERIIAQSTVWQCASDRCVARPEHAASVRACRAFVREAGPVTGYGPENAPLTSEQIAACNQAARTGPSAQQARN